MRSTFWLVVIVAAGLTQNLWAWGLIGHRVIGEIATRQLSLVSIQNIRNIIGKESLAQIANFPDEMKISETYSSTAPWHYVNVMEGKKYQEGPISDKGDLLQAIKAQSLILKDKKATPEKKRQALTFLVHFVGDLHQPLHNGYGADSGGNAIKFKLGGVETNFHAFWDNEVIDRQKLSASEYANFLMNLDDKEYGQWKKSTVLQWHEESRALLSSMYGQKSSIDAGDIGKYLRFSRPIVDRQLLLAGIRLAALLDDIFSEKELKDRFNY